jgi:hypothetical protein
MKEYKIRVNTSDGRTEDTISGHLFRVNDYLFGVSNKKYGWSVTELSTGMLITVAGRDTMKAAMKDASNIVKRLGEKGMNDLMKFNIEKYGRLNDDITPDMCREYVS